VLCMPRLRKVCRRCGYLAHARSLDARHHAGDLVCATPTHGPSFSACCSLQTCSTPRCAGTALAPSASAHSIYTRCPVTPSASYTAIYRRSAQVGCETALQGERL